MRAEVYASQRHASLLEILNKFVSSGPPEKIDLACFGIPGPVKGVTSVTTNLPWQILATDLEQGLDIRKVWLLNDLEAIAHGILYLDDQELTSLNMTPVPGEGGNAAVIAPGSGLGEAGIYWDGETYHPFGSEGGHCNFSPANGLQIELLQYLLKKYARVSWERLLSGPGLVHIYSFLRDTGKAEEPPWLHQKLQETEPQKTIVQEALKNTAPICRMTVDLFIELLAMEAAGLALKVMAVGGVYVAGGIVPNLLPLIDRAKFHNTFVQQGRLAKVLENVPLKLVMKDDVGIIGSARYALANNPDHAEIPVGLQTSKDSRRKDKAHGRFASNS